MELLLEKKIRTQVHYIPIHSQPYYKRKYKIKKNELFNVENFYNKEISLPVFPSLSIETAKYVARCIIKLCN